MPLYEYQCQDCGVRFERRQHISDEPLRVCPECGGEVHRLIQPVGVIFKGSGFYVTDNRAKSSTATPGSTHRSTKDSGESTSTSTSTSEDSPESSTKDE
jgi:putative FmdB family regulatory protein